MLPDVGIGVGSGAGLGVCSGPAAQGNEINGRCLILARKKFCEVVINFEHLKCSFEPDKTIHSFFFFAIEILSRSSASSCDK